MQERFYKGAIDVSGVLLLVVLIPTELYSRNVAGAFLVRFQVLGAKPAFTLLCGGLGLKTRNIVS